MRFTVCWWNTGLAPPRGTANDSGHLSEVVDTANMLMRSRDVDFLCLGEVNEDSIQALKKMPFSDDYVFVDGSRDSGGTKFNMGFVYKKHSAVMGEPQYLVEQVEQSKRKLAQNFDVTLNDGSSFNFFVVHWPSRLMLPPESYTRVNLGFAMRLKIDLLLDQDASRRIIVLGDFNDEPYNDSIARMLHATRDIRMAQSDHSLLYNPFWRSLTNPLRYGKSRKGDEISSPGTYYYDAGKNQKWRVFDQILVSGSLLGADNWHLVEDETVIWEEPNLLGVGPGKSKTIDHLPIFAVFETEL